nr:MAG TPA: Protein of unknown function (DUF739) [Caudoviricetes sp.]DAT94251.1 MAG TPA: Protein of unknown function (DUF739) [Caudoviricetes sp.]
MRVKFDVFIRALEEKKLTLMEFSNKSQTIPRALVLYLSGKPITFDKKRFIWAELLGVKHDELFY